MHFYQNKESVIKGLNNRMYMTEDQISALDNKIKDKKMKSEKT